MFSGCQAAIGDFTLASFSSYWEERCAIHWVHILTFQDHNIFTFCRCPFFLSTKDHNTLPWAFEQSPVWSFSMTGENCSIGIRQADYFMKIKAFFILLALSINTGRLLFLKSSKGLFWMHAISESVSSQQLSMVSTHYIPLKKSLASIKL